MIMCGKKSNLVYYHIKKLNNIYEQKFITKNILIFNKDECSTVEYYSLYFTYVKLFFKILFNNFFELIRSILKNRKSNFFNIKIINCPKNLVYNINNGTIVILHANHVDKYFFKDYMNLCKFYSNKYFSEYEIKVYNDFLHIRMPKYQKIASTINEELLIEHIESNLIKYNQEINNEFLDLYKLEYKIFQLGIFYKCETKINNYISVAKVLSSFQHKYKNRICHGDLWDENILEKSSNNFLLIDFDKTLKSCYNYDYVYYFLNKHINLIKLFKMNSDLFLTKVENLVELYIKSKLPRENKSEIILSMLIIMMIKITEYDLYTMKINCNISKINLLINHFLKKINID